MKINKKLGILFSLLFVTGCQVKNLDSIVGIDGRFLSEFNTKIQLGGVYYEKPKTDPSLPVSLDDLCLIVNQIHTVKIPSPETKRLPDRVISLVKNGEVQGQVAGQFGRFFKSALSLEAAANNIQKLNIKLSNITKHEISNRELSEIRKDIFSPIRKDCPRFLINAKKNKLSVHHIKSLYFGNIEINVDVQRSASSGAKMKSAVEAKLEGKLGKLFNSMIIGEANLFAVELQPQAKWNIFDD